MSKLPAQLPELLPNLRSILSDTGLMELPDTLVVLELDPDHRDSGMASLPWEDEVPPVPVPQATVDSKSNANSAKLLWWQCLLLTVFFILVNFVS